jgi:hypothetical protein
MRMTNSGTGDAPTRWTDSGTAVWRGWYSLSPERPEVEAPPRTINGINANLWSELAAIRNTIAVLRKAESQNPFFEICPKNENLEG